VTPCVRASASRAAMASYAELEGWRLLELLGAPGVDAPDPRGRAVDDDGVRRYDERCCPDPEVQVVVEIGTRVDVPEHAAHPAVVDQTQEPASGRLRLLRRT
jgi:hypothetical protein